MSFALVRKSTRRDGDSKISTDTKHSISPHHHIINFSTVTNLQHAISNQVEQNSMPSNIKFNLAKIGIWPKLKVSQPGDAYEQEADRVAEKVMTIPVAESAAPRNATKEEGIDRKCSDCEIEEDEVMMRISRKPSTTSNLPVGEHVMNEINNIRSSSGSPLDASTKEIMGSSFGHDFSKVKIHTDETAARSSDSVNALAYTVGNHIVFGTGQYAPGTDEGKRLLAHELTHVVQQRAWTTEHIQRAPAGTPSPSIKAWEPLEVVAERIARLATGPSSTKVNLEGGPGKVITVVRNIRTGQISVGLNTGTPAKQTPLIENAIEAQKARIAAGEVNVIHTAVEAVGGHSEVNALNEAIKVEQAALGHEMTANEIAATFEMHNVWLSGKRKLTTAPRCEHCSAITRGVKVTESLFKAEGGVSGEIHVTQHGKAELSGGKILEVEAIHSEIQASKPPPTGPAGPAAIKPTRTTGGETGPPQFESLSPLLKPTTTKGTFSIVGDPRLPGSVLELAADLVEPLIIDIVVTWALSKVKNYFGISTENTFKKRMEALMPKINSAKVSAWAEERKKLPHTLFRKQLYWIVELRIESFTQTSTKMYIQGDPDPKLVSVWISESPTGYQGPVQTKEIRIPADWPQSQQSQVITYSEPISENYISMDQEWLKKEQQIPTSLKAEEDVLRFSTDGKEVTFNRLVAWANRNFKSLDDPRILQRIRSSHEFKGSADAREKMAKALDFAIRNF